MRPSLNVHALPRYVEPEELAGGTTVVIDVLRASTCIVYALAAGARRIIPCLEIADARRLFEQLTAASDDVLMAGERDSKPIPGFHLGNSPEDFRPELVVGKTILLSTTNGTRAIFHARKADEILIAAFVNISAVVRRLLTCEHVHLLCAGTDGRFSREDILLAGMLVERLSRESGLSYLQNGQALTARETWLSTFALPQALGAEPLAPQRLAGELQLDLGGQKLTALGYEEDILAAAQIDRFDLVPRMEPRTCQITATLTEDRI